MGGRRPGAEAEAEQGPAKSRADDRRRQRQGSRDGKEEMLPLPIYHGGRVPFKPSRGVRGFHGDDMRNRTVSLIFMPACANTSPHVLDGRNLLT